MNTRQQLINPTDHSQQPLSGKAHEGHSPEDDEPSDRCTNPKGHEWSYSGTAYGGDDERWCGEGRCYCVHCGTDGDA